MCDCQQMLSALRRPRLLVRAARFGLHDYRRDRDLRRLTRPGALPSPCTAIMQLIGQEARQEHARCANSGGYSAVRHIDLLIAIMGEARLAHCSSRTPGQPPDQPKASGIDSLRRVTKSASASSMAGSSGGCW